MLTASYGQEANTMSINKLVKSDLEIIKNIVLTLTLLTDDVDFFQNRLSTSEKESVNEYRFLWRLYTSLYISMILDFNKLFDSNEKYSLTRLLKKVIHENSKIKWNSPVNIEDVKRYHSALCEIEISDIFIEIKTARDKYYAHLDRNRPPQLEIEIQELFGLLKLSQDIVNSISLALEGKDYMFGFSERDQGHGMINDLSNYLVLRHEIYNSVKKGEQQIDTLRLRDIMRKS